MHGVCDSEMRTNRITYGYGLNLITKCKKHASSICTLHKKEVCGWCGKSIGQHFFPHVMKNGTIE
jgi:hypothetical protein